LAVLHQAIVRAAFAGVDVGAVISHFHAIPVSDDALDAIQMIAIGMDVAFNTGADEVIADAVTVVVIDMRLTEAYARMARVAVVEPVMMIGYVQMGPVLSAVVIAMAEQHGLVGTDETIPRYGRPVGTALDVERTVNTRTESVVIDPYMVRPALNIDAVVIGIREIDITDDNVLGFCESATFPLIA
jgi:hypothetical protein